jgi:hypothetical protein
MKKFLVASGALLTLTFLSCSDINRSATPVQLIMSVTSQPIQRFDLAPNAAGCSTDSTIVITQIESRLLNDQSLNPGLLDVRITHYHVSYSRTDGGHQVPAPYDRTTDFIISSGTTTSDIVFHITDFQQIFNQAPFVALLPQNGGRDPETGSKVVKMNITIQIFGETLAGDRVSASTTFPLDVCFDCGGCQA